MKIYVVAIAKQYGDRIQEHYFKTLDDATDSFKKYKDFYFRAIKEINYLKTKTKHILLEKYINGEKVK